MLGEVEITARNHRGTRENAHMVPGLLLRTFSQDINTPLSWFITITIFVISPKRKKSKNNMQGVWEWAELKLINIRKIQPLADRNHGAGAKYIIIYL